MRPRAVSRSIPYPISQTILAANAHTHLRLRALRVVADQVGTDLDVGAVDDLGLGVPLPDPGDEPADCGTWCVLGMG